MCFKAVKEEVKTLGHVPDHFITQEICDKAVKDDSPSLQFVADWFITREWVDMWYDDYMMMMVVIGMMIMMKTNFLSYVMPIKNGSPRRPKLKKGSYPLPGIPQGGGIGVFLKMTTKRQKTFGHKHEPFCV